MGPFAAVIDFKNKKQKSRGAKNIIFAEAKTTIFSANDAGGGFAESAYVGVRVSG